jgi:hypothetical protein
MNSNWIKFTCPWFTAITWWRDVDYTLMTTVKTRVVTLAESCLRPGPSPSAPPQVPHRRGAPPRPLNPSLAAPLHTGSPLRYACRAPSGRRPAPLRQQRASHRHSAPPRLIDRLPPPQHRVAAVLLVHHGHFPSLTASGSHLGSPSPPWAAPHPCTALRWHCRPLWPMVWSSPTTPFWPPHTTMGHLPSWVSSSATCPTFPCQRLLDRWPSPLPSHPESHSSIPSPVSSGLASFGLL